MTWLRTIGLRLLLAMGLGFALWVFVSFTQNPDRSSSFNDVPVDIEALTASLVVVDQEGLPRTTRPTVDIIVDGDETTVQTVRPSDLRAFVDLSDLGPGEHSNVPVIVERNRPGLARLSFSADPAFLSFRLEPEITRTVALTIEVAGSVPFSFEKGQAGATYQNQGISSVQVRGPQSRVDRVALARVTADIDRLTANYSSSLTVEPLAQDGQPVEGVTVEPTMVVVQVPIVSSAGVKRVPVVPNIVGAPTSGYMVASVAVVPQFVRLTGSAGPLDSIQSVGTADVALAGMSGEFTRTVALRPPANTGLDSGEPNTAVVTVRIEPVDRPFQVTIPASVRVVDIANGLLFLLSPQVVQINLTGGAAQLGALDTAPIEGVVSARNLGPGSYTLVPAFQLPAGIRLAAPAPRVTLTLRQPSTPVPATPTDAPATPTEPSLAPTDAPAASPPTTAAPTTAAPAATATAGP